MFRYLKAIRICSSCISFFPHWKTFARTKRTVFGILLWLIGRPSWALLTLVVKQTLGKEMQAGSAVSRANLQPGLRCLTQTNVTWAAFEREKKKRQKSKFQVMSSSKKRKWKRRAVGREGGGASPCSSQQVLNARNSLFQLVCSRRKMLDNRN